MIRQLITVGLVASAGITSAQNMVAGEYWVDIDPGFGSAISFVPALPSQSHVPEHVVQLLSMNLAVGMHTIGYRTKDENLRWSLTNLVPIHIADSSTGVIVAAETFWDVDPGFGQGDPLQNWTPGKRCPESSMRSCLSIWDPEITNSTSARWIQEGAGA
jgi:hypothetical protein